MLEIDDLSVHVSGKQLLTRLFLRILPGETVVLFGPNGSGKTSLLNTIMGMPRYAVTSGTITFRGQDLRGLAIDERARLGIGMMFQHPPAVRGVKLGDMLRMCGGPAAGGADRGGAAASSLNCADFLGRDLNLGLSGGEIKRSELLQLLVQQPDLVLFDEPDSGVDLVNIHLVGKAINELLEKGCRPDTRKRAGLIITHAGHILDYVHADRAYVMVNGTVRCSGNPGDLLDDIRKNGYEECVRCRT